MTEEQRTLIEVTPEQAKANLVRWWGSLLSQQFGMVAAAKGTTPPKGMTKALARITAETQPPLHVSDATLGRVFLMMSQAFEAGMRAQAQADHDDLIDSVT